MLRGATYCLASSTVAQWLKCPNYYIAGLAPANHNSLVCSADQGCHSCLMSGQDSLGLIIETLNRTDRYFTSAEASPKYAFLMIKNQKREVVSLN